MFKKAFILMLILTVPSISSAESSYNYRTGTSTHTTKNYDGSTTVNNFNTRTGSTWRTKIKPNGDMSGTDSKGGMWNYNNQSGYYRNTDGSWCSGKGVFRRCY